MSMTKKKPSTNFEPGKVSLAIACLAAVTLLWLAILGVSS
jgi:hypothetical protein